MVSIPDALKERDDPCSPPFTQIPGHIDDHDSVRPCASRRAASCGRLFTSEISFLAAYRPLVLQGGRTFGSRASFEPLWRATAYPARKPSSPGETIMRIGFIGLGNMGGPMALNLIKAGHTLVVHDIRRNMADPHISGGAKWLTHPPTSPATPNSS
jgi:NAD binding domain of 6-phosphogluconate dehydrogenase